MKYINFSAFLVICVLLLMNCSDQNNRKYVSYYSNDSVKWEGILKDGLKVGTWYYYDSLGDLLMIYEYDNDTLVFKERYRNNNIVISEELISEHVSHGVTLNYYSNGNVMSKTNFYLGAQLGKQEFFYKNGIKKSVYEIDSLGRKNFMQYYENGVLFAQSERPDEEGVVHFYDSLGNKVADVLHDGLVLVDTLVKY